MRIFRQNASSPPQISARKVSSQKSSMSSRIQLRSTISATKEKDAKNVGKRGRSPSRSGSSLRGSSAFSSSSGSSSSESGSSFSSSHCGSGTASPSPSLKTRKQLTSARTKDSKKSRSVGYPAIAPGPLNEKSPAEVPPIPIKKYFCGSPIQISPLTEWKPVV